MIKIGQILNRWGPSIRVVPYNIKSNLYETITVTIDNILCLKNGGSFQKKIKNILTFKAGPCQVLQNFIKNKIFISFSDTKLLLTLVSALKIMELRSLFLSSF